MTTTAAIAAWGLASAHPVTPTPLEDAAFAALLRECERHRLLGLLGAAVRDGGLPVNDAQRAELDRLLDEWLAHAVRVERLAVQVIDALDRAGVRSRLLKGVALAHTIYPDPSWRVYGDVDVLVPSDRLGVAATTLVGGMRGNRQQPELRPGFDDRFGREALVRIASIEVDLHRTFVDGAYGLMVHLPDLFESAEPFRLGDTTAHAMAPAARVVHAVYASALGDWPPRLVAARDLAEAVLNGDADGRVVLALAERWKAESVLAHALRTAWAELELIERPMLIEWAGQHRVSLRDRLLLASYRGRARGYTSQAASLLVLPGIRERAAYLRAITSPSREYRKARGLGRFGLIGAGLTRARRGRQVGV